MTDHANSPRRLAPAIVLAAGLCLCGAGCGMFRSTSKSTESKVEAVERAQIASTIPVKPGKHVLRVSQFVFYSDVPLDAADPLFRELEDLPDQVQRELRLPASNVPIQVFLFEDQERYEAYIRARDPKLPLRPAFFFAEQRGAGIPDDLYVFTWMGRRLRTDLRHELTHALLHGVLKQVPLWLDEGLAGYFELPPGVNGVNAQHLEAVRLPTFHPNLARLEKLDRVDQMLRPEYQESWAWVHFMLRGQPKARTALLDHLQALRTNSNPGTLQTRLDIAFQDPQVLLVDHLNRIETTHTHVGYSSPR